MLKRSLDYFGFELESVAYVFRSELVLALRKRPLQSEAVLAPPAAGSPAELLAPVHAERV